VFGAHRLVEEPDVRTIALAASGLLAAVLVAGCSAARGDGERGVPAAGGHAQGRLTARPGVETTRSCPPGITRIGPRTGRPTLFDVPRGAASRRLPLVVSLHGAGGGAENGLGLLRPLADDLGFAVLAPASTGPTWDVVLGGFGADVARIDRALRRVFRRCSVDPDRIAVAGFSDGASYALSLGLANGDLFRHVIAFSPGFIAPAPAHGMPTVFISHGTRDPVLPIEQTSRRIAPDLRRAGYDVRYREFDAGHAVLPALVRAAITRAVAR
jgi:phospholipase/carboxylesterase